MFSSINIGAVTLLFLFSLNSCYYDNEQDLYGNTFCDTISTTYAATIEPIIITNCISCHSSSTPNGNINLESYTDVKSAYISGKLLCSIQKNATCQPMPPTGLGLSTCEINKFKSWASKNYPN